MVDRMLVLDELHHPAGCRIAIDLFFRTLADAYTTHAACVVMSGAGSDASVGITRVKEAGGIAIAQDPREAEHDSMPRSAINSGMVDFVLPVAEIPARLLAVWHNAQQIALPSADDTPAEGDRAAAEDAPQEVLAVVFTQTGHDFAHYKRPTVLRRIERRMQVTVTPDLLAYRDYLLAHPEEAPLLLHDLLINVTNFFRDRAAFDTLATEVVPLLFAGKAADDTVRVWVAGCASGEEACSLAILLLEHAARLSQPLEIQVFATDIDEDALHVARTGS
jgi:two-component system, chemotaxis family, CheB/CheR fusion protein